MNKQNWILLELLFPMDVFLSFCFLLLFFNFYFVCLDEVGCVDPAECQRICESALGCTNIAYPKLVIELMPVGKVVLNLLRQV